MRKNLKTILIAAFCSLLSAGIVAWAAQTNYLGTVFIADTTTPTQQLKVNSDGSINVNSSGGGGTVTANQGTAAAITGGWPVTDGAGADTSGSFTGTGAANVDAPIDGYGSAKIQIKGTYAGFTVNTKVSSDAGTTFVPLQCAAVDGSQFGTAFVLTANQSIEVACGHQSGDDMLRLQTSAGPATGTANVDISPSSFPSDDGNTTGTVIVGPNGNYAAVKAASTAPVATDPALVVALSPNGASPAPVSPYPATAVPITASTTGTTGVTTATLTNVTGHTTYICGFSIRANATAAATNNATITGTISGTLNFTQWTAPLASGLGVTEEIFSPCVPASAVSTSIAVVSGAPGTGGVVSVSAWGYSL